MEWMAPPLPTDLQSLKLISPAAHERQTPQHPSAKCWKAASRTSRLQGSQNHQQHGFPVRCPADPTVHEGFGIDQRLSRLRDLYDSLTSGPRRRGRSSSGASVEPGVQWDPKLQRAA